MRNKLDYMTKADYVYDAIKDGIIYGRYAPNEKIIIRNVAEEMSISDIPVREAMRKLEAEGLIVFVPHIGATVASVSYKEMEEIIGLRKLLEPHAGKLAAGKINREETVHLETLINQMDQCVGDDDYHEYGILNKDFHLTIYKACDNHTLYGIIKDLMEKTERTRAIFRMQPSRMIDSNNEHKELLDALKKSDSDRAGDIVLHQRILSTKRYLDNLNDKMELINQENAEKKLK